MSVHSYIHITLSVSLCMSVLCVCVCVCDIGNTQCQSSLHYPQLFKKKNVATSSRQLYFLLLSEKWRSSDRSSASFFCRISLKASATITLWSMTSLLKSDALPVLIMPLRTIESIRSSNSQQSDSLSGLGGTPMETQFWTWAHCYWWYFFPSNRMHKYWSIKGKKKTENMH